MRVTLAIVTACLVLLLAASAPAALSQTLDYDIPGGHFFKQTNGQNGAGNTGFAVLDDGQARFWTEFNRLGGLQTIGYPISQRFVWDGFTTQAFQKVIMQWRPEAGQAYFINVFDQLALAGKDPWLEAFRQVPPSFDTSADVGLSWPAVVARHLALLDANPAIRTRYNQDSDPVLHFGLPMSYKDYGNVFVVRAQRVVFQQWKVDVPWARAGQVVIANGGDVANEAGLLPQNVLTPLPEPAIGGLPGPVNDALVQLRQQFRVTNPDDVRLVSWEAVDFANSCLGLTPRDTVCAQAITPGYRLTLDVRNRGTFEYRVSATGLLLLPASAPPTGIERPLLTWEGPGQPDGICRTLTLAPNGEALVGLCGGAQVPLRLFDDGSQLEELRYFVTRFASFAVDTPAGRVALYASGGEQAPAVWQRAVAEWARLTQGLLRVGALGPTAGETLFWQTPAETAGICRTLRVQIYGRAFAGLAPCGSAVESRLLTGHWLAADDLTRLYNWVDRYEPISRLDGQTRLVLLARGSQRYSGAELVSVYTWAEQLHGRLIGSAP
ncbi:MAG: hypothetical protein ACYC4L_12105 [Chloroflexota bacterium]